VIITSVVLIWLGLALLFTVALCRAASLTVPEQGVVPRGSSGPSAAGEDSIRGALASEPPAVNANESRSVTPHGIERKLHLTIVAGLVEYLAHARWTSPQPRSVDASRRRQPLDRRHATVGQPPDGVTR